MARKLRLEYENALYHIINRGNYRAVRKRGQTRMALSLATSLLASRRGNAHPVTRPREPLVTLGPALAGARLNAVGSLRELVGRFHVRHTGEAH